MLIYVDPSHRQHQAAIITLLFVDNKSHYMWLNLLASKDKILAVIKNFQAKAEVESDLKSRVLRTYHGGEFTSTEFSKYCTEKWIQRHITSPYSPQQNGVIER